MKCANCDDLVTAWRVVDGIALCNACARDIPSDADTIKALRAELAEVRRKADEGLGLRLELANIWAVCHDSSPDDAPEVLGASDVRREVDALQDRWIRECDRADAMQAKAENAEREALELRAEVQRLNDADRLLREAHMATVRERDALAEEVERLRAMVPTTTTPGPGEGASATGGTVVPVGRDDCRQCGGLGVLHFKEGDIPCRNCNPTTPGPGEGGPW